MNNAIMQGCDISEWQGDVNFKMLKEGTTTNKGADFAILRAGYGRLVSQKDKKFETYYKGCKDNGINVGAYWYSYALSEEDAEKEAQACLECIKGKQFEFPIYFDVEEQKQFALGKEKVSAIIKAFCNIIERAGYWVGIYSNSSALQSYITDEVRKRYAVWVAHWGVTSPSYSGRYGIWQYSDKGFMNGVNGNVDLDFCYFDYPSEIKRHGLNGYTVEPIKDKRTIEATAVVDGVTYKGKLTEV